jgi:tryptophanyl-tRNA synthetase
MSEGPERIISGFRPTSDLTLGNYLGAIKPALEIQDDPSKELYVFVADLHGLTDHDPREIAPYRSEVIHDCLALGVDPDRTTIYLQSDTEAEVTQIANRLAPYASVAELARTPNLKEKMQTAVRRGQSDTDDPMKANFGLLGYPVLMAADIFAQGATKVAVGEDQEPHLELSRTIARRFNRRFEAAGLLPEPEIFAVEALRIVALDGKGKMSKTNPPQAIMLSDDPEEAALKIRKATTASAGEWNPVLDSHFLVASRTTTDPETLAHLESLRSDHMNGKQVMGEFKKIWANITQDLLVDFQAKKAAISDEEVTKVTNQGGKIAANNAQNVLRGMKDAMGL